MATLLLRHARLLATMDDEGSRYDDGAVLIEDNIIRQVGRTVDLPAEADEIIDTRDMLLMPGMVNTHHHFYQTLTRATPTSQDATLFDWLRSLYPIWANLTPEAVYVSTKVAMAELLLSGCTTSSDHHYIWPNGARLDDQIRAAREMGLRFHAARGSMSVGESKGGLPPDRVVEDEEAILRDSRRVIEEYHDAARYSMLRVVLAPCSPFSVSLDLMRESLALARAYGVTSHTHLAETRDEDTYCRAHFGHSPVELAEDLDWVGPDVWHAHVVHPSAKEVKRLGATRTGVAHCPSSNMMIGGGGIAPVSDFRSAGVPVGLGCDGSASTDSASLWMEARNAMLLGRMRQGPQAMGARDALEIATVGSAACLGRTGELGVLAVGAVGDVVCWPLEGVAFAGALTDPISAWLRCGPLGARHTVVAGRAVVRDGRLVAGGQEEILSRHRAVSARIQSV